MYHSPWLHRTTLRRAIRRLSGTSSADVAIVGGGISGVLTAYFVLTETGRDVVLLEADRVAHGASGHNAGVVTGYVERPVTELVAEYGRTTVSDGIREILSGWDLFDALRARVQPPTPIHDTEERAGYVLDPCLLSVLRDLHALRGTAVAMEQVEVADDVANDPRLAPFRGLYRVVPRAALQAALCTPRTDYAGLGRLRAACTNSAALCEDILVFLRQVYPKRFRVYENTRVTAAGISPDSTRLSGANFSLVCNAVVLCTNGYAPDFLRPVADRLTPGILDRLHAYVAYMAAYYEPQTPTSALAYFDGDASEAEPYFYLTARPSGEDDAHRQSLFCIGGPERRLPPEEAYDRHASFPDAVDEHIRSFLRSHSSLLSPGSRPFHHRWHGVMGYTRNRVRWVGSDHVSTSLYWNVGCNGIGLLPAFSAGHRIARLLRGDALPPSMFDVPVGNAKKDKMWYNNTKSL